jgi:hypothetical protein
MAAKQRTGDELASTIYLLALVGIGIEIVVMAILSRW